MGIKDIEAALTTAFYNLKPFLRKNPQELEARLARRYQPLLTRPPREFCIALRASDTRINLANAIITPEHAVLLNARTHRNRVVEHEVVVDKRLISLLVKPVEIPWHEHDSQGAARKLGTTAASLAYGMRKGRYLVDRIKGLGGKRVKVPLVWSWDIFDPCHRNGFRKPDIEFGCWLFRASGLADDFEQTLIRVPVYRRFRALPERFRGWKWRCPGCRNGVRSIFLPMPVPRITDYLREEKLIPSEMNVPLEPATTFACHKCHRLRYWTRTTHSCWNQLVAWYSGGLLYGKEVAIPSWFQVERRRAYVAHKPHITKGHDVERELRLGKSYQQIADDLQLALGTIQGHVRRIYKRHGVHSRAELIRKLGGLEPMQLTSPQPAEAKQTA